MSYPDLPNNRLVVDGVDLSVRFQMVLLDGYTLNPPEPKTYTVDIPGGNGVIDLTESLTGDVVYNQREQEFTFAVIDVKNFENVKTEVSNFLHGKALDYTMTMDPGYTYHGRFFVESYSHAAYTNGILGTFKIKVTADPYKLKEHCTYRLNATGGKLYRFESGRRPVHPVIECEQPCFVTWKGTEQTIPAGTYRLNDVLFEDGFNEIYVNSYKLWYTRWEEVGQNGTHPMTWNDVSETTWDGIHRIDISNESFEEIPQKWSDISTKRWIDMADVKWINADYRHVDVNGTDVYLKYDWEDL